jgi:hypothetical protein
VREVPVSITGQALFAASLSQLIRCLNFSDADLACMVEDRPWTFDSHGLMV